MELTSAFERLEQAIGRVYPQFNLYLLPGLSQEEVETLAANQLYRLPNDVKRLYQWRNGEGTEAPDGWNLTGTANNFLS